MKTILEGKRDADGPWETICSTSVSPKEQLEIIHRAKSDTTNPDAFPKGFKQLVHRPVSEDHDCTFAILIEKPSAHTIERTSKSKKTKS